VYLKDSSLVQPPKCLQAQYTLPRGNVVAAWRPSIASEPRRFWNFEKCALRLQKITNKSLRACIMAEGVFTVRVDPEKQKQIDQLAQQLDRSRNYLVSQAIDEFLATHTWQITKIEAGLTAAERGEFATDAELEQIYNRYHSEPKAAEE
jgi:predicted transcriptional regulator